MKKIIIGILILIFIVGCGGPTQTQTISKTSPFIGGNTGLSIEFQEDAPPASVFDAGEQPFDIVVSLKNEGEFFVPREDVFVEVSGINPPQFGVTKDYLRQSPIDDLIATIKDNTGQTIDSPPFFVEFTGLNHETQVTGASLTVPLRAEVCYRYGTVAASNLCIRENILNPEEAGICEINENKEIFNSGAPVKVTSFRESARSNEKVSFTFTIAHSGTGKVYEEMSECDEEVRRFEDRIHILIDTTMNNDLTCSGLTDQYTSSEGVEGDLTLFGGTKTVTCVQTIPDPGNYELPVTITMTYNYKDIAEKMLEVKGSGSYSGN